MEMNTEEKNLFDGIVYVRDCFQRIAVANFTFIGFAVGGLLISKHEGTLIHAIATSIFAFFIVVFSMKHTKNISIQYKIGEKCIEELGASWANHLNSLGLDRERLWCLAKDTRMSATGVFGASFLILIVASERFVNWALCTPFLKQWGSYSTFGLWVSIVILLLAKYSFECRYLFNTECPLPRRPGS